ncbi:MAG: protein tyrosine phosphatase family protein [Pseudomonadales bacterium]|nr:protein tyrosine phosphatase family protein [Pseudomonadales bacterium]
MNNRFIVALQLLIFLLSGSGQILAQEGSTLNDILNYREYSPYFASAGQPSAEQLQAVRAAGFQRVIYIAFTTNQNALSNEDQIVKELGMDYVHIPVTWTNPGVRDFQAFVDVMQRDPELKTFLHCQVNARASVFSFLYRVIYQNVPLAQAKADMNTVWEPDAVWQEFIFQILAEHAIDPDCPDCNWKREVPE